MIKRIKSIIKKILHVKQKPKPKQTQIIKDHVSRSAPKEKTGLGIDIGISKFATFSDGFVVESPFHEYHMSPQSISKDNFSQYRDTAHKKALQYILKKNPSYVSIESINLHGGNIPPNIRDRADYLDFDLFFKRLKSLCIKENIELRQLSARCPSSKTCFKCGRVNKGLKLSDREYVCECGWRCDRDLNAALNIAYRMSYTTIVAKHRP